MFASPLEHSTYLHERFLNITVNGVPHLCDHIGWFCGNLGCLSTTDTSVHWSVSDLPQNPCTSQ